MSRISEVVSELLDKYKKEKEEQSTEPEQESYAEIAARLEKEYPTQTPQSQAPQQQNTQKESYAQIAARLEKEYPTVQSNGQTQSPSSMGSSMSEAYTNGTADGESALKQKEEELAFWQKQQQNLYEDPDVYQSTMAPYVGRGEVDENGNEVKHSEAYMKMVAGDDEKLAANLSAEYASKIEALRKELAALDPERYGEAYSEYDFLQTPGAFKDGYDFGDVTKTVLGTAADAGKSVVKGAANFAEGVLDFGVHAAGLGADALGDGAGALGWDSAEKKLKNAADYLHQYASVNAVNNAFAEPDKFLDGYSVFGRTSESVLEGTGQIAANYATMGLGKWLNLGKFGQTALTYGTMGASSMGSGMSEAYAAGASDMDAFTYGLIAGAADTATEMLFGGLGKGLNIIGGNKGLLGLDDLAAKKISSLFSSQFAKNWAQWTVKGAGEGFEEWLAGTIQGWGKYVTYMSDSGMSLEEILADENRAEQFVVGFFTSGLSQGTSLKQANKAGVDFITGLTPDEQAAIDQVVENRIAEAEQDGTKLTRREKATIKVQVENAAKDLLKALQGAQTSAEPNNTVQDSTAEQAAPSAEEKWQNNLREAVWAVMDGGKKNTAQTPVEQENTTEMPSQRDMNVLASQAGQPDDIQANMPEAERYEKLKDKQIRIVSSENKTEHSAEMSSLAELKTKAKSKAEKIIKPLCEKLGIFNKSMKSPSLQMEFRFSRGDLKESIHKQLRYGGSYGDFANTMVNIDKVLENAVLVEVHGDKYAGTSRENKYLENVYVLFGAFRDGNAVIPVQMEIKKTSDTGSHLYMTVTMTKIEADVEGSTIDNSPSHSLVPASEYSIAEIFSKINPKDAHFLKYLPDQFLSQEQINAKRTVLDEDTRKIAGYARIEESPSGNSKNGFTDGATSDAPTDTPLDGVGRGTESRISHGASSDVSNNNIPQQSKNVNGNSSQASEAGRGAVGAAEQNFSGKAKYQDDNTQRDRPGDVRPMKVPKTDGYGRKVSETVANFYGAEITPDGMASAIEELVQEGALGFDVKTNAEAMLEAKKVIKEKGAYAVRTNITKHVANGKIVDGDIEQAMLLYATFANRNSQSAQDNAAELMVDLATMANMTGRNLQLFKILRKMTPQGQRMVVQRSIDRYVESLNSKRGKKKQVAVSIPQELWEAYEEAATKDLYSKTEKTEKEKAAIEDAIYKAAAAQIGATAKEKLNAWRYMAMLGNVKTQTRNFAGNALFRPLVNAKRTIGTALETMFLERDKRTKAVLGVGKEARALLKWAEADAKKADAKKLFSYSAKTSDNARSQIEDNRKIYDTKWLEATREFIQAVPEAADGLFKRREYAVSLASFLKARGYKVGDTVSNAVINEARGYAAQEALKATFNDMNSFSDLVVKMRYKGENPVGKALNVLGEGLLPFRRTPANILVRGVEYSPVNIVRATYNLATKVRSGEMSAATAVDQMASGLTGTGLMALGWALAKGLLGIKLVGYLDDEDKKNSGHQSYAIETPKVQFSVFGYNLEIGSKSFTIDWAAPANLPLFVGANIYNALQDKDPDTNWFMSTLSASAKTLEPMLELSCLSSLNDLVQDLSYAEDDMKMYTAASSMATSYLNQFIPTLFGQIEQATESDKTQVYSDADDPVQRRLETTLGQMTRKLPGDLFQAKKYDAWGNEEKTSGVAENAYKWFESFISPSYSSDLSDDPVDAEIMRLNEAQDINVTVKRPSKTISFTDSSGEKHTNQRLTAQQWEVMQREYGQTAHSVLTALMENRSYEAMTDTQKAEAFKLAYEYARETARIAAVEDYPGYSDGWMDGITGDEADAIIEKLTIDTMTGAISDLTSAWKYGRDDTAAVEAVEEAYSLYDNLTSRQLKAVMKESTGRVEGCYAAMAAGVDARTFADLYQTYYDISNSDSKPTEKANNWAAELQRARENGTLTNKQLKTMKENFTFSSGFTVDTEKFDELTGSGFSANESSYIMDLIGGLIPSSGRSTVSDAQKAEALAGSNLSEKDKQAAMILYLSDTQDENLKQMVAKGYSSEDYAHVYRIYYDEDQKGGKGTKARTIAKIRETLGCSYSVAEAVYNIYAK